MPKYYLANIFKPQFIGIALGTCLITWFIVVTGQTQSFSDVSETKETLLESNMQRLESQDDEDFEKSGEFKPSEKIVVATVACAAGKKDTPIYLETAVMMKSVVISASRNNVAQVDFHVFIEHNATAKYFMEKIKEFVISEETLKVQVHFHSAVQAVPVKYHEDMIYHKRFRCGYVRTFFPSALPNVDALLYLDTDIVVTGDIRRLWQLFENMSSQQMVAAGRNNEPEDINYGNMDKRLFGDIPHVPPKGINNGLLAMNLTRLRAFGWEEKFCQLYDVYRKSVKVTVQRVMNILFYYYPELLLIIPCELHFIHTHCTMGPTCPRVEKDSVGIHVVHGANNTFEKKGIFREIFVRYDRFDMSKDDFYADLAKPIKDSYVKNAHSNSKCYGYLNDNLFKNVHS